MEQKPSTARIALKWGVICGLALIILTTAVNISGLWKTTGVSMFALLIPLIAFLVLGMKEFREANGSFMSYSEGLGLGTLLGVISGILAALWGQVYNKFIDPTFVQQNMDFQMEKLEEQGLPDEQIEMAMEMGSKFSEGGIAFIMGLFVMVLIAFILSLIIAAIMKKNRPVF